ncbi:MAG: bifunctional riboflavin kinase/FMN adenylyltransferase, partial [Lachnospiraceae bacterium]|nr:bifunctional riboflavin kinase/FMN adenylyltransferase [Lachnospiraceae bacterium]
MIIIKGTEFQLEEPSAVVLGKFDGVHVGHRVLLRALMEQKEKGLKTVVFTFDKPPASLFTQSKEPYRELYTLEEKRRIFTDMGVDVLIEFPMNQETAAIPAEEFITEILQ